MEFLVEFDLNFILAAYTAFQFPPDGVVSQPRDSASGTLYIVDDWKHNWLNK